MVGGWRGGWGWGEREYEQRVDVAGSCRNLKKERARCRQESRVFPTACNTAPTILYPAGAQYSQEEGDKTSNGLRGGGGEDACGGEDGSALPIEQDAEWSGFRNFHHKAKVT